jgi:alpha-2-macroglobulin
MELWDEKVAFFISHLPQNLRELRYRVRVEILGRIHTLPTNGYCMYAPDVRCLSDEWQAEIQN